MVQNEINKYVRSVASDLTKSIIKGTIKESTLKTAARIYSGSPHLHEEEIVTSEYDAAMKAKLHMELIEIPQSSVLDVLKNFDEDMTLLNKRLKDRESKYSSKNDNSGLGIMNVRMIGDSSNG